MGIGIDGFAALCVPPKRVPEAGPGLFGYMWRPAAAAAAGGFAEGVRRRYLRTGRSYGKGSVDSSA
jgi:hypothetical protein